MPSWKEKQRLWHSNFSCWPLPLPVYNTSMYLEQETCVYWFSQWVGGKVTPRLMICATILPCPSHVSLITWVCCRGLDGKLVLLWLVLECEKTKHLQGTHIKVGSYKCWAGECKLVKKSSLPLVKVMIFQKPHIIVQIRVRQEKQTHFQLILIPNF